MLWKRKRICSGAGPRSAGAVAPWFNYLLAGGPAMLALALVSVVILALAIYCATRFRQIEAASVQMRQRIQERIRQGEASHRLGAFWLESLSLRSAVMWLLYLAHIATLLGLLGTVLGVQEAFGRVAQSQQSILAEVAGGIHQAVSTTIAGLCLAIPALVLHYAFRDRYRRLELLFSAGEKG